MMVDQVKMTGMAELAATLRALPKELRKRELDKGLRRGAKIVKQNAQALVPMDKGNLRKGIAIRAEKKKYLREDARIRVELIKNLTHQQEFSEIDLVFPRVSSFFKEQL